MTRRPYAAQSKVTGGLQAHTRETASPFPWGVVDHAGSGAGAPPRPPIRAPGGIQQRVGRECMRVVRARGQWEETKRRAAAMMLSRTGWDGNPPLGRGQTDEDRRAPWGCAAGAPYRGTASPPPPPAWQALIMAQVLLCTGVTAFPCTATLWASSAEQAQQRGIEGGGG